MEKLTENITKKLQKYDILVTLLQNSNLSHIIKMQN